MRGMDERGDTSTKRLVYVQTNEIAAAKAVIERDQRFGRPTRPAVLLIANAERIVDEDGTVRYAVAV